MLSVLREADSEIERYRANPGSVQQTFVTPLKDLRRFLATVLMPFPFERGFLATDQVVFEPLHLLDLLADHAILVEDPWRFRLVVEGKDSIAKLLDAVLRDCIDFLFVPVPTAFAIYADHDEYITLFAASETQLVAVTSKIERAGFEVVPRYLRPSSGKIWK
jgi:hypothetical protein